MRSLSVIENMIVIIRTSLENTLLYLIRFTKNLSRIQQLTLNSLMKIKKTEFIDYLKEKLLIDKQSWSRKHDKNGKNKRKLKS